MNRQIFTTVTPEELSNLINERLKKELKIIISDLTSEKDQEELLTRNDTAELLSISLVCLHDWCKKGILKPYKLGNRTYFKRSELIQTIEQSNV